jgi:hypothetical protein
MYSVRSGAASNEICIANLANSMLRRYAIYANSECACICVLRQQHGASFYENV